MKISIALPLILLSLPAGAQTARPLPGLQVTTAVGGTVTASAVPSIGSPVFDSKVFLGPKKRTASAAIGPTFASATGRARTRLHGLTPYFELTGSGFALGGDPYGSCFAGVQGGFLVPPGAVANVCMSISLQVVGGATPSLVNATVTDGTTSTTLQLTGSGSTTRHVALPPGAYSVTGNLQVGDPGNPREEAAVRIHVSFQFFCLAARETGLPSPSDPPELGELEPWLAVRPPRRLAVA